MQVRRFLVGALNVQIQGAAAQLTKHKRFSDHSNCPKEMSVCRTCLIDRLSLSYNRINRNTIQTTYGSTQRVQTSTDANLIRIRSPGGGDFLVHRYICDEVSTQIRSIFGRFEPDCVVRSVEVQKNLFLKSLGPDPDADVFQNLFSSPKSAYTSMVKFL